MIAQQEYLQEVWLCSTDAVAKWKLGGVMSHIAWASAVGQDGQQKTPHMPTAFPDPAPPPAAHAGAPAVNAAVNGAAAYPAPAAAAAAAAVGKAAASKAGGAGKAGRASEQYLDVEGELLLRMASMSTTSPYA